MWSALSNSTNFNTIRNETRLLTLAIGSANTFFSFREKNSDINRNQSIMVVPSAIRIQPHNICSYLCAPELHEKCMRYVSFAKLISPKAGCVAIKICWKSSARKNSRTQKSFTFQIFTLFVPSFDACTLNTDRILDENIKLHHTALRSLKSSLAKPSTPSMACQATRLEKYNN